MRSRTLIWAAFAGFLTTGPALAEPYAVGLTTLHISDPQGFRPLQVHVLYPAERAGEAVLFADNEAQHGFEAIPDAPRVQARFPLAVLSHGLYGKWTNYGWLAAQLAARGMIVAAPTHPGTAWTDKDSPETPKLWERPRDISHVVTHLTADPEWQDVIDGDHIGAIGHSLGGYTVLAAAGGRFDTTRYARYCETHPGRGDCRWYRSVGLAVSDAAVERLERSYRDPRIAAVVSYDLGFTQAFDPASLADIAIPVLVIGAGNFRPELPVADESRRLAALLPAESVTYREIADVSHFSIFPRCKPGAVALLEAIGEGDEIICGDGGGRDRAALHEALIELLGQFFSAAGFFGPHNG